MVNPVKTLCPYCGVGCGLEVLPPALPGKPVNRDSEGNPIWHVRGDRSHPSSHGMVCVKGATIAESLDKDRLRFPMMRDSLDEPFRRVSWDEALTRIVTHIRSALRSHGADSICMYGSGQFQTEDYYIAQKLLKGCLGTNNFDANSRLCMSSAVAGYIQSFGTDGPPCTYDDLDITDCAFLIGTNTADCHPIIFNRLKKSLKKQRGSKLIVVDPRRTETAEAADLHLAIKPGTDIDLLNGIGNLLLRWNCLDKEFIEAHTTGFTEFEKIVSFYPPELVSKRCGISQGELEAVAELWAGAKNLLSLWSMGINQSSEGTAKVCSLINLHLATGQISRPGAGPFSLTGQPNAMGGREAGGLSHLLPGYRLIKNPDHRAAVEAAWHLQPGTISPQPGRTVWDMILGMETGEVQLFWVAATNPVVSMPDLERTKAALRNCPLVISQEPYNPTEMTNYAHILLPVAQWSEKTGAMTNSERRVTLCPAFRSPPGEARVDWQIFAEVGRRLGFGKHFAFNTVADVYTEFTELTRDRPCDVTGLSHDRLRRLGPTQWPHPEHWSDEIGSWGSSCPIDTPEIPVTAAAKRLYTDRQFNTPDGRAKFIASHSQGLAEPPDLAYPFVLTTGRLYGHWHTQSRTGRIEKTRKLHPNPFIEVHPRDAKEVGVKDGEWVEVRSRRGKARFPVTLTKNISPGTVFVPMHWGALWAENAEANAMTTPAACPISKQPELKACAVQLTRL
jgi:ferredoxin-nitrate reductase